MNGFLCKHPSTILASDFKTLLLNHAGDLDSIARSSVSMVTAAEFPGLNTLGLSMARTDIAPYGVVLPHSHPRASEMMFVHGGSVVVGFLDTEGRLFQKRLGEGEVFVFPRGLLHYVMNYGFGLATAFSVLNSQNPGVVGVAHAMFFASDSDVVEGLMARMLKFGEMEVTSRNCSFSIGKFDEYSLDDTVFCLLLYPVDLYTFCCLALSPGSTSISLTVRDLLLFRAFSFTLKAPAPDQDLEEFIKDDELVPSPPQEKKKMNTNASVSEDVGKNVGVKKGGSMEGELVEGVRRSSRLESTEEMKIADKAAARAMAKDAFINKGVELGSSFNDAVKNLNLIKSLELSRKKLVVQSVKFNVDNSKVDILDSNVDNNSHNESVDNALSDLDDVMVLRKGRKIRHRKKL
ncbi:Germin-like protein subfamily 3 member 4 [Zea mays]|uniref:Germin-like protein subfamily 3 member 4 n=1 Tax=Zea mays TaxID=4577 RepID=A0A1D6QI94_MAIZE|nr:Germin-like protein subfamily 3 member 4 [Zea mays]